MRPAAAASLGRLGQLVTLRACVVAPCFEPPITSFKPPSFGARKEVPWFAVDSGRQFGQTTGFGAKCTGTLARRSGKVVPLAK